MPRYESFVGGALQTNGYLVPAPLGHVLIDAPEGVCDWLRRVRVTPDLLVLTHGHFDHLIDAARLRRECGCPVACHRADAPLLAQADAIAREFFGFVVEPVEPDRFIDEGPAQDFLGVHWDVLHVPGHSAGSLCFHWGAEGVLFAGDVLFNGGIGRSDLPGGDGPLLIRGIREKLFVLPDDLVVLPGHGPATTIGHERRTNPFVR